MPSSAAELPARLADVVSKIIGGGHGGPMVVLRSSGGAHTATKEVRNEKHLTIAAGTAAFGKGDADVSPVKASEQASAQGQRAHAYPVNCRRQYRSGGSPPAGQSLRPVGQTVPTLSFTAVSATPSVKSLAAPPTAVVPSPPPDLDEILEEPHTFLVGAVAHVADAVLDVFLTPFGPGSPAQSPVLWTRPCLRAG